jgi:hypothetical protein
MKRFFLILIAAVSLTGVMASAALANETFTGIIYDAAGHPQPGATVYLDQSTSSNGPWTTVQTCTSGNDGGYGCGSHADNYYYRWTGVYIPNCFKYWAVVGPKWVNSVATAVASFDLNQVTRICSPPS